MLEGFTLSWPQACPLVARGPYGSGGQVWWLLLLSTGLPPALKPEPTHQHAYLTPSSLVEENMKIQLPVPFLSASAAACLWKTGAG